MYYHLSLQFKHIFRFQPSKYRIFHAVTTVTNITTQAAVSSFLGAYRYRGFSCLWWWTTDGEQIEANGMHNLHRTQAGQLVFSNLFNLLHFNLRKLRTLGHGMARTKKNQGACGRRVPLGLSSIRGSIAKEILLILLLASAFQQHLLQNKMLQSKRIAWGNRCQGSFTISLSMQLCVKQLRCGDRTYSQLRCVCIYIYQ